MKRKLFFTTIFFLLLSAAGIWYLLFTQGGLLWIYRQAVSYAPGSLSIQSLTGRLAGPLEVRGLKYSSDTLVVGVNSSSFDWKPGALLSLKAHIIRFDIDGIQVEMSGAKGDQDPGKGIPEFRLPIGIEIDRARAGDITIADRRSGTGFTIKEVSLGAGMQRDSLHIRTLEVETPEVTVSLGGFITTTGAFPLDLSVAWNTRLPGFAPIRGSGDLAGTLDALTVSQAVVEPFRCTLQGTIRNLLATPLWEATLTISELTLSQVKDSLPRIGISGQVKSSGGPSKFDLTGSLAASEPLYGAVSGNFSVQQSDGSWTVENLLLTVPGKETRLELAGTYSPVGDRPSFSAKGTWSDLAWPLQAEKPVARSSEGEFGAEGFFDDYGFTVATRVAVSEFPEALVTARGKGRKEGALIESLSIATLGGTMTGDGKFTWLPAITWKGSLEGDGLNPGQYDKAWEGKLSFSVRTGGTIDEDTRKFSLDVYRIQGELRGYPVDGTAHLEAVDERFTISRMNIRSGSAFLTVSGELSHIWDLNWEFNAQDLGEIIPEGRGTIGGAGGISGPRKTPEIMAEISGSNLQAGDFRADTVRLHLLLDTQDQVESRIDFTAGGIETSMESIEAVTIQGRGKMSGHQISILASGETAAIDMSFRGNYADGSWAGSIEKAALSSETTGSWKLKRPESLSLSRDSVKTGELCWIHETASACNLISWGRNEGLDASASFENIPLSLLLEPTLPGSVKLEGTIGGTLEVAYSPEKIVKGQATLNTSSGSISYLRGEKEAVTLPFQVSRFSGKASENTLDVNFNIFLEGRDVIDGTATLPIFPPTRGDGDRRPIKGRLQVNVRDPGLIPAFIPQVADSQGTLKGDITIAGTLTNPTLTGELRIEDLSADITDLGIRVVEARLAASSDGTGILQIDGEASSGGGLVRIDGKIKSWQTGDLLADFQIQGERFEAIKTVEYWLLLSPDMDVKLERDTITVTGTLEVPEGTIEPVDLSGAVPVSRDVEIVDESGKKEDEEKWKIISRVNLILGDKVRFDGFGLSASISGNVVAEDEPKSVTRGTGKIQLTDGKFDAYGQKLEIERGQLIFAGGPIADPALDVRAARKIREVTVGVDVSGTVMAPRLELFSSPAMSRPDILAYLLFGRPARNTSGAEASQMGNVAGSAGLIGGEIIAQEIGALFGVENVTIEEGKTREEASLFIGTYLSPRLYVSYGIGLFQPVSTYRVRYDISTSWFIQAETGIATGADIFYKLER